jgi:hypothetical protein
LVNQIVKLSISKIIFILILPLVFLSGNSDIKYSFVNITSNVDGAKIYLDEKHIGQTPLKMQKVTIGKNITLKGENNSSYHLHNIEKTISLKPADIKNFHLEFSKTKSTLFLIGEDGNLYINGVFNRTLRDDNRLVEVDSSKKLKIEIFNGHKEYISYEDVSKNQYLELNYKLIKPNYKANLYTLKVEDYLWQDNDDAKNKLVKYEDAKDYCKDLELAGFNDWYLPDIEQLQELYNVKDKIYHGIGKKAYWSSQEVDKENAIWTYALAVEFEKGKSSKKVADFFDGNVRCIRDY